MILHSALCILHSLSAQPLVDLSRDIGTANGCTMEEHKTADVILVDQSALLFDRPVLVTASELLRFGVVPAYRVCAGIEVGVITVDRLIVCIVD